jgi:alpha-D-ribose 1-methylphosphonate 5-triphosphate synthase subunit PhnH
MTMLSSAPSSSAPPAGFSDPVQQSQASFRALLDAMARPGCIASIAGDIGRPDGVTQALAAAALTLCDLDTPVWLGPGFDTPALKNWLRFHTGAPVVAQAGAAQFALLNAGQPLPNLENFAQGSDEAPEKGATLLIQVATLQGKTAMQWRGPGIKDGVAMPPCGLPMAFWQQRAALSAAFPRGLDLYLCCSTDLIGLPRSTAITFATEA